MWWRWRTKPNTINIDEEEVSWCYAKDIVLNGDETFLFVYIVGSSTQNYDDSIVNIKWINKFELKNLKLIPDVFVDQTGHKLIPTFKIGFDENKPPKITYLEYKSDVWINNDTLSQINNQAIQLIQKFSNNENEIRQYIELHKNVAKEGYKRMTSIFS